MTFSERMKIFESLLVDEGFSDLARYAKSSLARLPLGDKLGMIRKQIQLIKQELINPNLTPQKKKEIQLKLSKLQLGERKAIDLLNNGAPIKKRFEISWNPTY